MSCTFLFPSYFVKFSKKSLVLLYTCRYPVLLAFIPLHWTPGSMSGEWEGWLSSHDIRL